MKARRVAIGAGMIAASLLALAVANRRLLAMPVDATPTKPMALFAAAEAWPTYMLRCATCHGLRGEGRVAIGAPRLTDVHWLNGSGATSDIERTILFGIRSGDPRARNVTDMPAFRFEGRLTDREIAAVTEHVLAIAGRPHDPRATALGRAVYVGKGVCYDCHGVTGEGQPDFGAPSLRALALPHGGDRATIRRSIAEGRHGLCPAWIDRIGAAHVRALAMSLHDGRV